MLTNIVAYWDTYGALALSILAYVVLIANAITAATPTTVDNKYWNYALKALNFLSVNFGKNKNADAVAKINEAYKNSVGK